MAAPRYRTGDEVRVADMDLPGHVRTPWYVRGSTGTVVDVHGRFRNPESLGHGGDGLPERWLYQVAFASGDLWEPGPRPTHAVHVDVYEHWLVPTSERSESQG